MLILTNIFVFFTFPSLLVNIRYANSSLFYIYLSYKMSNEEYKSSGRRMNINRRFRKAFAFILGGKSYPVFIACLMFGRNVTLLLFLFGH